MKRSNSISVFLLILSLTTLLLLAGCSAEEEVFTAKSEAFNTNDVESIVINADVADVTLITVGYEDTAHKGFITVEYSDSDEKHYDLKLEDEVLTVTRTSKDNASIDLTEEQVKLTIWIDSSFDGDLNISTALGDIDMDMRSMNFQSVTLRADVGDIEIAEISAETFDLKVGTGDLYILHIGSEGDIVGEVAKGDIYCYFDESYNSLYDFEAVAVNGDVTAPRGFAKAGRTISMTTNTGNIEITLE